MENIESDFMNLILELGSKTAPVQSEHTLQAKLQTADSCANRIQYPAIKNFPMKLDNDFADALKRVRFFGSLKLCEQAD